MSRVIQGIISAAVGVALGKYAGTPWAVGYLAYLIVVGNAATGEAFHALARGIVAIRQAQQE